MNEGENIKEFLGRTLFFFGAGATKDAGCYTSLDMIEDLEINPEFEEYRESLHFLLSALEYHSKWKTINDRSQGFKSSNHLSNIEDLALLLNRIVNRDSFLPYPVTGS